MNTSILTNPLKIAAVAAALSLACGHSARAAISLDFTLPDLSDSGGSEAILNYYNGGADQNGGTGPNYGITFGADALSLGQYADYPGYSNTGNEPGGGDALFFLSGSEDEMDIAGGFTTGFSFYYDCPADLSGSIEVWSGVGGTGTLLASLDLPGTSINGTEPYFGNWTPIGVTFSGTAESVDFTGTANEITFADVTIGSGSPQIGSGSPVPDGGATLAMLGSALAGLAALRRRFAK